MIDVDDTSRCPLAAECATCGSPTDFAVATADTPVGVLCLTLCALRRCRGATPDRVVVAACSAPK